MTPGQTHSKQRTELHNLVLESSVEKVKELLISFKSGPGRQAMLDVQEEHGYTPLIDATSLKDQEESAEMVKVLIEAKVSVDIQDRQGYTAVHWSAACGNDATLQILLDSKANLDIQCECGETALHRAARLGYHECVQKLVEYKCNVNALNHVFESAFDIAGVWGNKVKVRQRQAVRQVLYAASPTNRTLILHHHDFLDHITREGHQESPARVSSILSALRKNTTPGGLIEEWELKFCDDFSLAPREAIARAHSASYIQLIDSIHDSLASSSNTNVPVPFTPLVQKNLRVPVAELKTNEFSDTSFSQGSRRAAMRGAGAVIAGIDRVMGGEARNAFCIVRPPGHHAGVNGLIDGAVSCGFCIFNSVAIGALHAHDKYPDKINRVAIIDFDVHHGNGTEDIIASRFLAKGANPTKVFFFSIHLFEKSREYEFYPGSGYSDNTFHNIVNVPLVPLWSRKKRSDKPMPKYSKATIKQN